MTEFTLGADGQSTYLSRLVPIASLRQAFLFSAAANALVLEQGLSFRYLAVWKAHDGQI
jgi:hypothetical protein